MNEQTITISGSAAGMRLSDYLASQRIELSADCGGLGTCGKCKIRLISGKLDGDQPDKTGKIRACKAICTDVGAVIAIPTLPVPNADKSVRPTDESLSARTHLAIALDLGTTTLAMALVDLHTQKVIRKISRLNPQRAFGADVMSRISAADSGHLSDLQNVILQTVREMMTLLSELPVTTLAVAGNPTMLHLLVGISPTGIGKAPFIPSFTDLRILCGDELGLPANQILLLPSASAFIGSDITAGVLFSEMFEHSQTALLSDLGTNGETVLSVNGKLFAASAAAGPALEGAGITCGVGGISGAVSRVDFVGSTPFWSTVDRTHPVGICGSGLIDLIAGLLRQDIIDETGYMENDFVLTFSEDGLPIRLTPEDIRAFQLAKSALRAAMETLLSVAEIRWNNLSQILLAGGLGFFLRPTSAVAVGLLPATSLSWIRPIGNAALDGTVSCLLHPEKIDRIQQIAQQIETVALNQSDIFSSSFLKHMRFPHLY